MVAVPGGGVDEFGEAAGGDDKEGFAPHKVGRRHEYGIEGKK